MKEFNERQEKYLRDFSGRGTKKSYGKPTPKSIKLMIARKKVEALLEEKEFNKQFESL